MTKIGPRLRTPPNIGILQLNKNFPAIALWYGGEVKRYLRLVNLSEDRRKTTQLLQQAILHAKVAWYYARRSYEEGKE